MTFTLLTIFVFEPIELKIKEVLKPAVTLNWHDIIKVKKEKVQSKNGALKFLKDWSFDILPSSSLNEIKGIALYSENYWGSQDWVEITFYFDRFAKLKNYKVVIKDEKN